MIFTSAGTRLTSIAFLCLNVCAVAASHQPAAVDIYFPYSNSGLPQIDGGLRQEIGRWPATLKFFSSAVMCTATFVGERVVLTAAHCIPSGSAARIHFPSGDTQDLKCSHHPKFNVGDLREDVALCLLTRKLNASFLFESIDFSDDSIRTGDDVFLLGFGCRNVDDVQNSSDQTGQLYGGKAKVSSSIDRVTGHFTTNNGVVICPGDSGGAAYLVPDVNNPDGARSILGINSAYDSQKRASTITSVKFAARKFVMDWAADNKVAICGVHPNATNCRDNYKP